MQGQLQQFASAPQAVGTRKKYREPGGHDTGSNIMHDKRVVRGTTSQPFASALLQDTADLQKQRESHRRRVMRASQTRKRMGTPEPVSGRKHMDMQTEKYLEELTERTVEFEAGTQTDFILERPSSPLFMPSKIGVDIETQIEEGELFDFDEESEPLLDILMNKTLEQSLMEVMEEEELEALRQRQEDWHKARDQEKLEVERMEHAEKRRATEMSRRIEEQAKQRQTDLTTMKKVVSRSISAKHLSSLMGRTLKHMKDAGIFADALDFAVDATFVPSLLQGVMQHMSRGVKDRELTAGAMKAAVSRRMERTRQHLDAERRRLAAVDEAEQRARDEKKRRDDEAAAEQGRLERAARGEEERLAALALLPPVREVEITEIRWFDGDDDVSRRQALTTDRIWADVDPEDLEVLEDLMLQRQQAAAAGEDMAAFRVAAWTRPGAAADAASIVGKFSRLLDTGRDLTIPEPPAADDGAAVGPDTPGDT